MPLGRLGGLRGGGGGGCTGAVRAWVMYSTTVEGLNSARVVGVRPFRMVAEANEVGMWWLSMVESAGCASPQVGLLFQQHDFRAYGGHRMAAFSARSGRGSLLRVLLKEGF